MTNSSLTHLIPPAPARRDSFLHVRLTRSEKAEIEALADQLDVQLSHLVRHVLLQSVRDLDAVLAGKAGS